MRHPVSPAADRLYRNAACIRAVQGKEVNAFAQALDALARVADAAGTPIAIVGGLAGIHHKILVTTLDVDIVVMHDRLEDVLAASVEQGLVVVRRSAGGWHQLQYHGSGGENVAVQIIPEGAKTPRDPVCAPAIPSPQVLGVQQGLGYASFAGWAVMKLVANRDKDRYHLIEALKQASQEQISQVVKRLRKLDRSYLTAWERLLQAAEQEDQQEW